MFYLILFSHHADSFEDFFLFFFLIPVSFKTCRSLEREGISISFVCFSKVQSLAFILRAKEENTKQGTPVYRLGTC